jgi:YidC/Oxa1 family membrane protein insertase
MLPLIMIAISFFQQKLTSPGQMNEQQKAMAMMMPVVLGVVFYNFPSGLALYFLTNAVFSFFVQLNLMRGRETAPAE